MMVLALVQVAASPEWVGPTMAISLAVIALSFLGIALAVAIAALKLTGQVKKISTLVDGLQDDIARTLKAVRRLTEQGQDVMVVVRQETGAFAQTARRLRRKLVRAVDRVEAKLQEVETLYEVVHDEVEGTALDVAAALRSVRRGNGMLGRVRRLLVPSR
jgi:MFS superfamily sulfate permease-like transporter